jgi:hypothetical protein
MRLHLLNPKKRGNAVRLVPSAVITVLKARARNYFALEIVKKRNGSGVARFWFGPIVPNWKKYMYQMTTNYTKRP